MIAATSTQRLAAEGLDPLASAAELDADFVLQGTMRESGSQYRLTVRLLDVAKGTYAWSDVYDLEPTQLLSIDQRVVNGVVASLPLSSASLASASVANPATRDALLRARFLIDQRTRASADRALQFLDDALVLDSTDAAIWVERANAHLLLGEFAAGEAAISSARELAPNASGLDRAAGRIALYGRREVDSASTLFARAVQLEPGVAATRHVYAQTLAAQGRLDEASRQGNLALTLDPVSSVVRGDIGWVFYYAGAFDRARVTCRDALELVPESVGSRVCTLLSAHFEDDLGSEVPILTEVMQGLQATESEIDVVTAAVREGDSSVAWSWLLEQGTRLEQLSFVDRARLQALLGRNEQAESSLARARESGALMLWVGVDPVFQALDLAID